MKFIFLTFLLVFSYELSAVQHVRGYTRKKSGKYVQSHYRTTPNNTKYDNYSHKGNLNPYTGKHGTEK